MSGRAGRRGLDDRGIVILMIDEKMPPAAGKLVLKVMYDASSDCTLDYVKLKCLFFFFLH